MRDILIKSVIGVALTSILIGCATDPPILSWKAVRDDATPMVSAVDRCQYETASATQVPDYSVGAMLRDVDQKQRRFDLMVLCMRAQGYEASTVSEGIGPQSQATWKQLEKDLTDAKQERAQAREMLVANPSRPNAAYLSQRIHQLNAEVRSLEIKLSYSLTPPVSTVIALPHTAPAAAKSFEFKGFSIGGSKAEFLQKHPWKCYPRKPQHGPHDEVCMPDSYADKTYMGHPTEMSAEVLDGRIVQIRVEPWSPYYEEILSALSERYGKPDVLEANPPRRQVRWGKVDQDKMLLSETVIGQRGSLMLVSAYGTEELNRRRAALKEDRKKDM